jgi:alpha-L-fucosidase
MALLLTPIFAQSPTPAPVVLPAIPSTTSQMQKAQGETPAQKEARYKRWRDVRFGMCMHWGPVTLTGKEISFSRAGARPGFGSQGTETPVEVYDNLYKKFDPVKFNADEWVKIAQGAGVKYMVLICKHLDGFCMWDSKLTDYKITNSPFKRDVTADLAAACQRAGMRFGVYYAPPDWHHPDYLTEHHDRYIEYYIGQVRELLTNYGQVDELWLDGDGKMPPEKSKELFDMIYKLQPQIMVSKRQPGGGDFDAAEQTVGPFSMEPTEFCTKMSDNWSWSPNSGVQSFASSMKFLIQSAGADSNFLYNVPPSPDGEFDPRMVARLKEMGDWLAKYGESIYETRGGPFKPSARVSSTRKGNTIYIHLLGDAGDYPEMLELPPIPAKIIKSTVLTGGRATVKQTEEGIQLTVPKAYHQPLDTIVALELDKSAMEIQPVAINTDKP